MADTSVLVLAYMASWLLLFPLLAVGEGGVGLLFSRYIKSVAVNLDGFPMFVVELEEMRKLHIWEQQLD